MKNVLTKLFILFLGIGLVGCTNNTFPPQGPKQTVGIVTGAVAGGLIGSAVGGGAGKAVAIGVGIVAGALIGGAIGKSMDDTDRMQAANALEHNPPGKSTKWVNTRTGATYTVTPTTRVTMRGNPNCRKYRTTVMMNGHTQQVYGVACRANNGTWHTVS